MADKNQPRKERLSPRREAPGEQAKNHKDDVPDVNVPDPAEHDRAKPSDDDKAEDDEQETQKEDGTAGSEGAGRDVGLGPDKKIGPRGEEQK